MGQGYQLGQTLFQINRISFYSFDEKEKFWSRLTNNNLRWIISAIDWEKFFTFA
jgi:hypothetical protein